MHDAQRTANLLGATALAVTDLVVGRVTRSAGVSTSGASALVVLSESQGISVTELGRRIGLSQSAAARMIDSLSAAQLVTREPGSGREVGLQLTTAGADAATTLLAARAQPLVDLLVELDTGEQETLAALLEKLLARLYTDVGSSELLCRLCDRARCTTDAVCPVGQAERNRIG
jgi:MarR family transcriptional regulator, negative regulator of the multidrug operon emrRAB